MTYPLVVSHFEHSGLVGFEMIDFDRERKTVDDTPLLYLRKCVSMQMRDRVEVYS